MENNSSIKERILQFAKYQNISIEVFLASIGMTYGSFKGAAKQMSINSDALEKIYAKYPNINLEWLLTGRGEKLITDQPKKADLACSLCKEKDRTIKSLNTTIEMLEEKVEKLRFRKPYVIPEDTPPIAAEPAQKLTKK